MDKSIFDVIVIGGGPAGMMSAITASEKGARVLLIDKNKRLGKKLLLTGNGRCNLTNAEFDTKKLIEKYGRNGSFLLPAFLNFNPKDTIDFFEYLGVKTKIEEGKRVFPVSDKSIDVLAALEGILKGNGVNLLCDTTVSKVDIKTNHIKKLSLSDGREVSAQNYIFATGGKSYPSIGSDGSGFSFAQDLGHKIVNPEPGITPIKLKEVWVKGLQSLSVEDIKVSIFSNDKKVFSQIGKIIFTHFGVSGPLVLDLSKRVGELLKKGAVKLKIDFAPDVTPEALEKMLIESFAKNSKKIFINLDFNLLPNKLLLVFSDLLKIPHDKIINSITKEERRSLVNLLKSFEVTVDSLLGFDVAKITIGGVSLDQIDNKTMRSKIIDNLFFAGEIIDIDGPSGGFNLQACFSTGHLAGEKSFGIIKNK